MGCDGGTIPRRDELVRLQKKPEQKDKESEREFRWLHCALTQQRLQQPIVMCGLGRLYSKQNVIEQLLDNEKMPELCQHIKSLKDVKNLNLSPNPEYKKDDDKCEGLLDTRSAPFICKLIGIEMSGKFRFVALWSCGCVFSERALKETSKGKICILCQTPFTDDDIVILNGNEDDTELMRTKMLIRVAKRKTTKKSKTIPVTSTVISSTTTTAENINLIPPSTSSNNQITPLNMNIKSNSKLISSSSATVTTALAPASAAPTPASATAAPAGATAAPASATTVNDEPQLSKKMKHGFNKRNRLSSIGHGKMEDPEMKRLKTEYSVAKDPKASEIYKSLFTSHKSEQEQTRAHWVTYNPFYN